MEAITLNASTKKQKLNGSTSIVSRLDENDKLAYAANPSFYSIAPTDDVSLDEFERFALDRKKGYIFPPLFQIFFNFPKTVLKVLVTIDEAKKRGEKPDKFIKQVTEAAKQYLPLTSDDGLRKDVISHFALRLAYCKP